MKKMIAVLAALMLSATVFAGCETSSSKTFTFDVETGDTITVEMDTSGGEYNITSEVPFEITKSGEVQSEGRFLYGEVYSEYEEAVNIDEKATVLDSGITKNGNDYIFWTFDNQEFNYIIMVKDCQTAVLIANDVSKESAEECFKRLTIYVGEEE